MAKQQLQTEELVERISKALLQMSGEELAELYNREFGSNMKYISDGVFEQEQNEDIEADDN